MKIEYSDNKDIRTPIAPKDLQANTLYDFDDTQVLIDCDFKAIQFMGNVVKVWDYEDIRDEKGFSAKFYLSYTTLSVRN